MVEQKMLHIGDPMLKRKNRYSAGDVLSLLLVQILKIKSKQKGKNANHKLNSNF